MANASSSAGRSSSEQRALAVECALILAELNDAIHALRQCAPKNGGVKKTGEPKTVIDLRTHPPSRHFCQCVERVLLFGLKRKLLWNDTLCRFLVRCLEHWLSAVGGAGSALSSVGLTDESWDECTAELSQNEVLMSPELKPWLLSTVRSDMSKTLTYIAKDSSSVGGTLSSQRARSSSPSVSVGRLGGRLTVSDQEWEQHQSGSMDGMRRVRAWIRATLVSQTTATVLSQAILSGHDCPSLNEIRNSFYDSGVGIVNTRSQRVKVSAGLISDLTSVFDRLTFELDSSKSAVKEGSPLDVAAVDEYAPYLYTHSEVTDEPLHLFKLDTLGVPQWVRAKRAMSSSSSVKGKSASPERTADSNHESGAIEESIEEEHIVDADVSEAKEEEKGEEQKEGGLKDEDGDGDGQREGATMEEGDQNALVVGDVEPEDEREEDEEEDDEDVGGLSEIQTVKKKSRKKKKKKSSKKRLIRDDDGGSDAVAAADEKGGTIEKRRKKKRKKRKKGGSNENNDESGIDEDNGASAEGGKAKKKRRKKKKKGYSSSKSNKSANPQNNCALSGLSSQLSLLSEGKEDGNAQSDQGMETMKESKLKDSSKSAKGSPSNRSNVSKSWHDGRIDVGLGLKSVYRRSVVDNNRRRRRRIVVRRFSDDLGSHRTPLAIHEEHFSLRFSGKDDSDGGLVSAMDKSTMKRKLNYSRKELQRSESPQRTSDVLGRAKHLRMERVAIIPPQTDSPHTPSFHRSYEKKAMITDDEVIQSQIPDSWLVAAMDTVSEEIITQEKEEELPQSDHLNSNVDDTHKDPDNDSEKSNQVTLVERSKVPELIAKDSQIADMTCDADITADEEPIAKSDALSSSSKDTNIEERVVTQDSPEEDEDLNVDGSAQCEADDRDAYLSVASRTPTPLSHSDHSPVHEDVVFASPGLDYRTVALPMDAITPSETTKSDPIHTEPAVKRVSIAPRRAVIATADPREKFSEPAALLPAAVDVKRGLRVELAGGGGRRADGMEDSHYLASDSSDKEDSPTLFAKTPVTKASGLSPTHSLKRESALTQQIRRLSESAEPSMSSTMRLKDRIEDGAIVMDSVATISSSAVHKASFATQLHQAESNYLGITSETSMPTSSKEMGSPEMLGESMMDPSAMTTRTVMMDDSSVFCPHGFGAQRQYGSVISHKLDAEQLREEQRLIAMKQQSFLLGGTRAASASVAVTTSSSAAAAAAGSGRIRGMGGGPGYTRLSNTFLEDSMTKDDDGSCMMAMDFPPSQTAAEKQLKEGPFKPGLALNYNVKPLPPRDDTSMLKRQMDKCGTCQNTLKWGGLLNRRQWHYCRFTGMLHCSECHKLEKAIIPSRVLNYADTKPTKVSCEAKKYLDQHYDVPLIDPMTMISLDALNNNRGLKQMRLSIQQIKLMAEYLNVCPNRDVFYGVRGRTIRTRTAISSRDLAKQQQRRMKSPPSSSSKKTLGMIQASIFDEKLLPLLEFPGLVSVHNLVRCIDRGSFVREVMKMCDKLGSHIARECSHCRMKGHCCEICGSEDVMFPFQFKKVVRCSKCKGYFHRRCYLPQRCPRCARRSRRSQMIIS